MNAFHNVALYINNSTYNLYFMKNGDFQLEKCFNIFKQFTKSTFIYILKKSILTTFQHIYCINKKPTSSTKQLTNKSNSFILFHKYKIMIFAKYIKITYKKEEFTKKQV